MKKQLCLLVVLGLIFCCSFTTVAQEKISFSAEDTSTKNNRIFTLTIKAVGNEKLSAATFDFTYNSDFIQFRQAKSQDENTKIKTSENGGKLKLIFLNEKGVDLQENPELFTIDFKAENILVAQEIAFKVTDCVNSNVESVSATGNKATVSLIDNASSNETGSKSKFSSEKSASSTKEKVVANESNNTKTEETQETYQGANTATQNVEQADANNQNEKLLVVGERDNTLQIFAAGAVMMFVLVSVCAVSYHIGRKSKDKDENSK